MGFEHYKSYNDPTPIGPPRPQLQTLHFEWYITDEEVSELLLPFKVQDIRRRDHNGGSVQFFATYDEAKPFHMKFQAHCKQRYAELAPIWEAEREARFQEYFKSLNLDEWIEIPGVISYKDGGLEKTVFRVKA